MIVMQVIVGDKVLGNMQVSPGVALDLKFQFLLAPDPPAPEKTAPEAPVAAPTAPPTSGTG